MLGAEGGCSNIFILKGCDAQSVTRRSDASSENPDEWAQRLPLPGVRGHLQSLFRHRLREEALATLPGGAVLTGLSQRGIEHEPSRGVGRESYHRARVAQGIASERP